MHNMGKELKEFELGISQPPRTLRLCVSKRISRLTINCPLVLYLIPVFRFGCAKFQVGHAVHDAALASGETRRRGRMFTRTRCLNAEAQRFAELVFVKSCVKEFKF
jgi:hypothetical protein